MGLWTAQAVVETLNQLRTPGGFSAAPSKLVLDFFDGRSLCRAVTRSPDIDEDSRELAVRLLTRAGVIMEDASADAVLSAQAGTALLELVGRLELASRGITSLVAAAKTLLQPL